MEIIPTIKTLTQNLVTEMINDPTVEVSEVDGMYRIQIAAGEDAPSLIGRHGETIRSLQKILEVMLFKKFNTRIDIIVNVNDYREKQIERLQDIATEIANKVLAQGSGMPFRGLNSYERRIVHEYITKTYPSLTTYSTGEGHHRTLTIDLQSASPAGYNDEYAKNSS